MKTFKAIGTIKRNCHICGEFTMVWVGEFDSENMFLCEDCAKKKGIKIIKR